MRKSGLKIAALLLASVFVFAVFPSLKSNADPSYSFDSETGTLKITGSGTVSSNSFDHFAPKESIKIVVMEGVTSIGNSAFSGCTNLTDVTIPSSVTSIDSYAFNGCSKLTNLTIPSSVTSIGTCAFQSCTSLTELTIPSSVTSIDNCAFQNCSSLTDLTIDSGNPSIGNSAFRYCKSLTRVTLSENLTSIGYGAFQNCTSLTGITIPGKVTEIGAYAFGACTGLANITIPSSVTSIGDYAFSNCTGLKGATIPDSVTSIGNGVFFNCSSLTGITIPGKVTEIGMYAFSGCSSLADLTIPSSVTSLGDYAFRNCTSLTGVTIPISVTSLGDCAFENCESLTEVVMGCVSSPSDDAFAGCPADIRFHYYYNATYTSEGNGTIEGNSLTYGTDKLTVIPDDYYEVDKIILRIDDDNEITILPDENGDYYMPDLDASITERDVEIVAGFKLVQVAVTFYDEDGTTVLQSGSCDYGAVPAYTGNVPSKAADEQYTYTFAGWTDGTNNYGPTDALPKVNDNVSYTALYVSAARTYTVKFTDESGKELQSSDIAYGQTPSYTGDEPAKAATSKYVYTFAGWTDGTNNYGPKDTLPQVTGDVTYKAIFTEKDNPECIDPKEPDPVDPVDPDDPQVSPVKPDVEPDIRPAAEADVQKPGVYYLNSLTGDGVNTDIVATVKRTEDDANCINYFDSAEVDGKPMTVGEQILTGSGSTIITIKKEYLATIGEGNHILTVFFNDGGKITIEFTVKAAASNAANIPATGETVGMTTVLGACLIIGASAAAVVFAMKKRRDET